MTVPWMAFEVNPDLTETAKEGEKSIVNSGVAAADGLRDALQDIGEVSAEGSN